MDIYGIAPLIQVFDMPAALHFYRDILGFKVTGSSGAGDDVDWIMMELNGAILMMNTTHEKAKRPPQADATRNFGHGDVTLYFDCHDLDIAYKHLTNSGVNLKQPFITIYNWRALHFRDPDNYQICLHHPLS
jgi:uncharacterized glyoxalase superfamily protein PhnB